MCVCVCVLYHIYIYVYMCMYTGVYTGVCSRVQSAVAYCARTSPGTKSRVFFFINGFFVFFYGIFKKKIFIAKKETATPQVPSSAGITAVH